MKKVWGNSSVLTDGADINRLQRIAADRRRRQHKEPRAAAQLRVQRRAKSHSTALTNI